MPIRSVLMGFFFESVSEIATGDKKLSKRDVVTKDES